MNFIRLTLGVALLISAILSPPLRPKTAIAQSGGTVHVVRPGENLSSIAARYNISYVELARINGITNPNRLRVGQRLEIPARPPVSPTRQVVPPSLTPIQTPTRSLMRSTSTRSAATARASATRTPVPGAVQQPPVSVPGVRRGEVVYRVRGGDTLSDIASRFGITIGEIMRRNYLRSTVIYVGQRLIIPGGNGSGASGARPTPTKTRVLLPGLRATPTPSRVRPFATGTATQSAAPRLFGTPTRNPGPNQTQ